MLADLGRIYDDTITVINKLDAKDAALKQDSYFKTVLHHCMWNDRVNRVVKADGTVVIGVTHKVQIPKSENYLPYRDWKDAEDRTKSFTLRAGDYVVKGEVPDDVTASTLRNVVKACEPDAFQLQVFRDTTKGEGFSHSTDGIMRFIECFYVEG